MSFRHKRKIQSVKEPVTPAENSIDKVLMSESRGSQIGF